MAPKNKTSNKAEGVNKKAKSDEWKVLKEAIFSEQNEFVKIIRLTEYSKLKYINVRVMIKKNDELVVTRTGISVTVREAEAIIHKLEKKVKMEKNAFSSKKEYVSITPLVHAVVKDDYIILLKAAAECRDAFQAVPAIFITVQEYKSFLKEFKSCQPAAGKSSSADASDDD